MKWFRPDTEIDQRRPYPTAHAEHIDRSRTRSAAAAGASCWGKLAK